MTHIRVPTFALIFAILLVFLLVVLHADRCLHLGGAYAPIRLSCTGGPEDFPSFLEFSLQPRIFLLSAVLAVGTASVLYGLFDRFVRRGR